MVAKDGRTDGPNEGRKGLPNMRRIWAAQDLANIAATVAIFSLEDMVSDAPSLMGWPWPASDLKTRFHYSSLCWLQRF